MIRRILGTELSDKQKEFIAFDSEDTQGIMKALERGLINNDNGVGLPYWSKKNPQMVKDFTFAMVSLGYGKVTASRNYSRFEWNADKIDRNELKEFRIKAKLNKFVMRKDIKDYETNKVKSNGKIKETGLRRPGFAKVAKNMFKYDQEMLQMYFKPITQNLVKSMRKAEAKGQLKDRYFADEANFEVVVNYCMNHYMLDGEYNLEYNVSDSRGRSIYNALKRVGNPVASKDFRALLVMPEILVNRTNMDQMGDIYYFIAELMGSKAKSEIGKINDGIEFYSRHELPKVNVETEEGRKNLHELMWLTRIYTRLDRLYASKLDFVRWDIPVEIDASMSIAQFVGALTNDSRLLTRTNMIGDELSDPWYIAQARRLAGKSVGTPTFYGSSQSPASLIKKSGLSYLQMLLEEDEEATQKEIAEAKAKDKAEVKAIRKEFAIGGLAVMRQFKDAVIQNFTAHDPSINVKIWHDSFFIEVNKFKQAGTAVVVTEAWNGKKYAKSFTREPVLVPDYKYMKLFWATCLIHNLDSQVMDNIATIVDEWMLTIHDAIITAPGVAKRCRVTYAGQLKAINKDRNEILRDFRRSIGATSMKADIAFMKLYDSVQQAEDVEFNATAMK